MALAEYEVRAIQAMIEHYDTVIEDTKNILSELERQREKFKKCLAEGVMPKNLRDREY